MSSADIIVKFDQSFNQIVDSNQLSIGPSIVLDDPYLQSCTITSTELDKLIPRTSKCNFQVLNNPTKKEIADCINSNPCTIGRMVFKPPFNPKNLRKMAIGCVFELDDQSTCLADQVPVFNTTRSGIDCVKF